MYAHIKCSLHLAMCQQQQIYPIKEQCCKKAFTPTLFYVLTQNVEEGISSRWDLFIVLFYSQVFIWHSNIKSIWQSFRLIHIKLSLLEVTEQNTLTCCHTELKWQTPWIINHLLKSGSLSKAQGLYFWASYSLASSPAYTTKFSAAWSQKL